MDNAFMMKQTRLELDCPANYLENSGSGWFSRSTLAQHPGGRSPEWAKATSRSGPDRAHHGEWFFLGRGVLSCMKNCWRSVLVVGLAVALLLAGLSPAQANVTLEYFQVTAGSNDGELVITWGTQTETDIAAFQLRRNTTDNYAGAQVVNQQPPQGSAVTGGNYSYTDRGLIPGQRYYYWLIELTNQGAENVLRWVDAVAPGAPAVTATPTATATSVPTATPTTEPATGNPTATATPTPRPTATPTAASSAPSSGPTPTPLPTLTPTPTPTATPTPASPTPTPAPATPTPLPPTPAPPTPTPTLAPPTPAPPGGAEASNTPTTAPSRPDQGDQAEEPVQPSPTPTPTVQAVAKAGQPEEEKAAPVPLPRARPTATPRPPRSSSGLSNVTSLLLVVGSGSICGAVLLALVVVVLWRRQ